MKDLKKDFGDSMHAECREVIQEVLADTGSPSTLLYYCETAHDVAAAKSIRLSSGGEIRLACLGEYLDGVNEFICDRVVCQLVLGYVDDQLEARAGKIMREKSEQRERERKEQERKERERREQERREQERREQERKERERREQERREQERKEREKREQERKERERREQEKREQERKEQEKREQERREQERKEQEKREQERKERERRERERREQEKREQEQREQERNTHPNLGSMTLSEQLALFAFPEPWKWECMSTVGAELYASSLSPDHPISKQLVQSLCITPRRVEMGTTMVRFVFELKMILNTLQDIKQRPSTASQSKSFLISQCETFAVTFYRLKYVSIERTLLSLFRNLTGVLSLSQKTALEEIMEDCRMATVMNQSTVEWTDSRVQVLLRLFLGTSELKLLNKTMKPFGDIGLLELVNSIMIPTMYLCFLNKQFKWLSADSTFTKLS